jgi:uncharacterized surface protein with fasciclin (FAS1) repeats
VTTVPTLFELVAADPSLTNLTAAVVRAGLDVTLNSPNKFTLFCPNDDAFAKVPADVANNLFTNDAFIPHLTDLLLYHVLGIKIFTNVRAPFRGRKTLLTLNGQRVAVSRFPTAINGNKVVKRNIKSSNGVADILDGVLLPSWVSNNITSRVAGAKTLSTLFALVTLAELGDTLAGPGTLTLVAPTNSAFAKLSNETLVFLTSPDGNVTLTSILLYHVFPDILVSSELTDGLVTSTLEADKNVTVVVTNAGIFLNGKAKVLKANILVNNGVIHTIDTVLDLNDGR